MSDGLTVKGVEQNTGTPIYQGTGTLVSITGITGQPGIASGNFDLQLVEGDLYINWDPALTTFDYNASLSMSTGSCAISLNGLSCSVRIDGTSTQDGKTQEVRFSGDLSEASK